MKTIGILGGMSAASTLLYYQELCRLTQDRLGGLHSPQLLIRSVDFAPIAAMQADGDWDRAAALLNAEARALERGGADILLIATNTMHKLAAKITAGTDAQFIRIGDATAHAIKTAGYKRPALMATAFTMEQTFYTDRLVAADLQPIVPNAEDRAETHRIIYEELCKGQTLPSSRTFYEDIAKRQAAAGADCLILGCTEVGMLLNADNSGLPVFDTTLIHCRAALDAAMAS